MEENKSTETIPVNTGPGQRPAVLPTLSQPSNPKNKLFATILLVFVCVSAGFFGGWAGASSKSNSASQSSANVEQGRQVAQDQSELISSIAKDVGSSVVSINVTSQAEAQSRFFGPELLQQESAGTGFIISKDGFVATNRHVIGSGVQKVSLTMSDGTVLDDVSVVGRTADGDSLDLGFLKINDTKGKELKPVRIGDSGKMEVGDTVIAIGNALGQFQNTVTSGILSGYGRSVSASDAAGGAAESLQNLFQTDAAINQGNSGGPLVNINGEVIGINTAVAGGSAQNIGFSIPINDAKGLIKSVLEKGKLERPYLGVRYIQLTPAIAKQLNLSNDSGAYVQGSVDGQAVMSGSPASKAGIKEKDIITKVNDQPVDKNNTLSSVIGRFSAGDSITLTIIRDGKEQTINATLEAMPGQ